MAAERVSDRDPVSVDDRRAPGARAHREEDEGGEQRPDGDGDEGRHVFVQSQAHDQQDTCGRGGGKGGPQPTA
ncbi:hypothetical protein WBK31_12415 [Nonomuraea sp. N2-4H]|uniref:hypothetical protein n=1 Tax=Nonomuraea sp. N2-4H TaxID=3128898 RepID=UPI00324EA908